MVRKLSISPEESDLSLPTREEEREVKDGELSTSNHSTWSSRIKGLEAYICVNLSLMATLDHCRIIGIYGSVALFAYFVFAIVIGMPIVLIEVMTGRYVIGNVAKAWSMCPVAKGVLLCLIGATAYTIIINNVCNVYLFKYLFSVYHGYIEWDDCRQPWARDNCFVIGKNSTYFLRCVSKFNSESYCRNLSWQSSGVQYWEHIAKNSNSIHEIISAVAFLAISVGLIVLINFRGHRSCEKAFVILVYVPIVISLVLTYVSYNSFGALYGVISVLKFDLELITSRRMWLAVFEDFILSTGFCTLSLSYVSSHGRFRDNIFTDVLVVISSSIFSLTMTAVPLLSVVFPLRQSSTNGEFFCEDEGLLSVFLWVSEAFVHYPYPNVFWTFLFYLEMLLISFGNQAIMFLAFCEAVWSIFSEKKKFLLHLIVAGVVSFASSIPYLFTGFDFQFPIQTSATTTLLLFAITLQIFYGCRKFIEDHHFMLGHSPSYFILQLNWLTTIPTLLVILGLKIYYKIPDIPLRDIVYIYIAIPVVLYICVAAVLVIWAAKQGEISSVFRADPNWGPDNQILKLSRLIFDTRTITKEYIYRQELYKKPLMKHPDFSQQNITQII